MGKMLALREGPLRMQQLPCKNKTPRLKVLWCHNDSTTRVFFVEFVKFVTLRMIHCTPRAARRARSNGHRIVSSPPWPRLRRQRQKNPVAPSPRREAACLCGTHFPYCPIRPRIKIKERNRVQQEGKMSKMNGKRKKQKERAPSVVRYMLIAKKNDCDKFTLASALSTVALPKATNSLNAAAPFSLSVPAQKQTNENDEVSRNSAPKVFILYYKITQRTIQKR